MDMRRYYANPGEQPLDCIKPDGGFTSIFRTIACIGDSLSSGEFESLTDDGQRGYHDLFEYSWGQYIARAAGCKVYNFSRGGMTASEYCDSFAQSKDFWNPTYASQAYIVALGVNDLIGRNQPIGTAADICLDDCEKNAETFAGYYGKILQRYRAIEEKSRLFLMTIPRECGDSADRDAKKTAHAALLHEIANVFPFTYVIDLYHDGPVYDELFHKNFFLSGHLNPAGYRFTAEIVMTYIDYIIRNNPEDFTQVGFIGTGFHNVSAKW